MADVLFAGAVAAVAIYCLRQQPEKQEGAASNVTDNLEEQGAALPKNNNGESSDNASTAVMVDPPAELKDEEPPADFSAKYSENQDFLNFLKTPEGISEFSKYKKRHNAHKHPDKRQAFYWYFLRSRKPAANVKRAIRNLNNRTAIANLVTTNQALNPNRVTQYRDRGNTAPYLASFLGRSSRITRDVSNVDRSPFTIKGFTPILERGMKTDGRHFRSDFDPEFVNYVPNSVISNKVRHQNRQPRPKKVDLFQIKGKNMVKVQ